MDGKPWEKSYGNPEMDVTMGSKDGAETCELVGLFLIFLIRELIPNFGLYRDDGAGVASLNGVQWNRLTKELHALMKNHGLSITISTGQKVMNFLDVVFNLENNTYKPYINPNQALPSSILDSSCISAA